MKNNPASNMWIAWRENPRSPRYRLHHSENGTFFFLLPWFNLFLIATLAFFISNRITLSPGILFTLPSAPFTEGSISSSSPSAVLIRPFPSSPPLVFFDDIRYRLLDDFECARLSNELSSSFRQNEWNSLTIHAAHDVPHGDVIRFVNIARKAGIAQVNIAINPE